MRKEYIYAIYEDDTFITMGTLKEIASYLGINYTSLRSYKSKGIKYIFIKLDKKLEKELENEEILLYGKNKDKNRKI